MLLVVDQIPAPEDVNGAEDPVGPDEPVPPVGPAGPGVLIWIIVGILLFTVTVLILLLPYLG